MHIPPTSSSAKGPFWPRMEMHGIANFRCPSAALPVRHLGRPVLSYGCEVWAVKAGFKDLKQLDRIHT